MSVRMHVDNGAMRAEALWYVASGRAELRQESVSVPKDAEVLSVWFIPDGCRRASTRACARRAWGERFRFQ